jgi:hypothetical protein
MCEAAGIRSGTTVPTANGLPRVKSQMSMPQSFWSTSNLVTNDTWEMPPNASQPVLAWQIEQ